MSITSWRSYVKCRFGQMHVHAAQPARGVGEKTPLVCFHTSPLSGLEFEVFQKAAATDRLVLCPDTPGFGGSDGPGMVPTIRDYAGAMADLVTGLPEHFGRAGPVDVLGVHTGSLIATELAAGYPTLVRKAVLSSIALFSDAQRADMKRRFGGPQPLFEDPDFVPKVYRETVLEGPLELTAERRLTSFAERMRSGIKSWYGPEASLSYDPVPRLRALGQPVLLFVVKDVLAANTRDAAQLVSHGTLVDIESDTTAWPWDAQAELLARHVRAYLDAA